LYTLIYQFKDIIILIYKMFTNKPTICTKCCKKIYYNNKHHCIEYEPCSLELQEIADDIDEELNTNNTGIYLCNGVQYNLTYDELPKLLENPAIDIRPQSRLPIIIKSDNYKKFDCEFCGQSINKYRQKKHELTSKCTKAKYYYKEI